MTAVETETELESVEDFRLRARAWLADNMPKSGEYLSQVGNGQDEDEHELEEVAKTRVLQRKLFDGGLAGITVPKAYGGQGLTPAHQIALNEEITGYDYPTRNQVPTFTPCLAVLLEFASEETKLEHIPKMLNGEEIWMQLLSEPSGGSDAAGAQTTAVRDGDEWVINGSKIWTTGAWWSDWGLALVRTNPEVPKHRGLSVFIFKLHQPGIEVHRIEMLNGSKEFCQEFITDLRVPDSDRVGEIDDGWTVGIRWMYHERTVSGGSQYVTRPAGAGYSMSNEKGDPHLRLARKAGKLGDSHARQMVGEAHALGLVRNELIGRVSTMIGKRKITDQAAAIGRLFSGRSAVRISTIDFDLAGPAAAAWEDEDASVGRQGIAFLTRQSSCIAGGTTEMAANVVSERVLMMPRERTMDKDIPFRDVPKGPPSR